MTAITQFNMRPTKGIGYNGICVIPSGMTSLPNFYGNRDLKTLEIPASLTQIDPKALSGCKNLSSVTISQDNPNYKSVNDCCLSKDGKKLIFGCNNSVIPDGVTEIGNYAFGGRSGLTGIKIPDAVTLIGKFAFWNCTGLTSIEIPDGTTKIGKGAFKDCSKLADIKISNGVIMIEALAFSNCPGLATIKIPSGVTNIEAGTFRGCSGLTAVEIPDSVTELGEGAFESCKALGTIKIPDNVTVISKGTFEDCTGLTSIEIPGNVGEIGRYAFKGCSALTSIEIPDSVITIEDNAFADCTSLESIHVSKGNANYKSEGNCCLSKDGREMTFGCRRSVIPGSVTKIGDCAFLNCKELTGIEIPDNVTEIGARAFEGCTGLTDIKIPDSVTAIGAGAFRGCTGLASVNLPEKLTAISKETFGNCSGLTDIKIPESVMTIGAGAFQGCTGLASIVLPDSLTAISDDTFRDCTRLTDIEIPNSVTAIGAGAFRGCTVLASIDLPDGLTTISDGTFEDCSGLTDIKIPFGVTEIKFGAFSNCTGLTAVEIPDSVKVIGLRAFYGCNKLTDIKIPDSVTKIKNYAFSDCTGLSSIRIPSSVTDIDGNPFSGCTSVTSISVDKGNSYFKSVDNCCLRRWINEVIFGCKNSIIPASTTIIGEQAFENCTELTAIKLPDRLREIRGRAFSGCTGLTDIKIPDGVEVIGSRAFDECPGWDGVEKFDPAKDYLEHVMVLECELLETKHRFEIVRHREEIDSKIMDRYGFPKPEDFPIDLLLGLDEDAMIGIIRTLGSAFYGVNSFFGHFSKSRFSWNIKHLYISADRKHLVEYFRSREWRLNPWDEDELCRIPVLGEYYHKDFITLYYNTIKDTAKNAPEGRLRNRVHTVMRYVYLHEMMHQYFDRFNNKKDEMEIEEGLAEFGALYVLDELVKMDSAYDEELEWALNFVESKRGILRCYSNGARLFRRYKAGQLELKNLLEAYC